MNEERSRKKRERLVENLKREGIIKTDAVEEAFLSVPREIFLPPIAAGQAYIDRPLSIGEGQTISAPHMIAIMEEEMQLEGGLKVLEIGGGSGYHAAITAYIVGDAGRVVSIEAVPSLARSARKNLEKAGIGNVTLVEGDGSVGYPKEAPYDRIYYTCAAPHVPDVIRNQVADGGIILSVEGPAYSVQRLIRYQKKDDGTWNEERLTGCVFVPLVGEEGYR